LDAHHFEDKSFGVDFFPQFFNDGLLKSLFGDASLGAFAAFAIGECAEVGLILFVRVLAVGCAAIERRSTAGAVGKSAFNIRVTTPGSIFADRASSTGFISFSFRIASSHSAKLIFVIGQQIISV